MNLINALEVVASGGAVYIFYRCVNDLRKKATNRLEKMNYTKGDKVLEQKFDE